MADTQNNNPQEKGQGGNEPSAKPEHVQPSLSDFASQLVHDMESNAQQAKSREEVRGLLRDAESRFQVAPDDYSVLAECEHLLDRAAQLAPENAEVTEFRDHVMSRYARLSLAYGDLWLARTKSAKLSDGDARAKLFHQIEEAEEAARDVRRRAAQRTFFAGIATALALVLGSLLLLYIQHSSLDRIVRAQLRTDSARQEEDLQQAEQQLADGMRRNRILNEARDFGGEELVVGQQLLQFVPSPARLHYDDEMRPTFPPSLRKVKELAAKGRLLRRKRDLMLASGAPVGPPAYDLALAESNLELERARDTTRTLTAYELYGQAAHLRPDMVAPLIGMAVSAARAGYPTSAALHLTDAAKAAGGPTVILPPLPQISLELDALLQAELKASSGHPADVHELDDARDSIAPLVVAARAAEKPLNPVSRPPVRSSRPVAGQRNIDTIIESCAQGLNHELYAELEGPWIDTAGAPDVAKSRAPGLTPGRLCGGRSAAVLPGPTPDNEPATVWFSPGLVEPAHLQVYVTWPRIANVTPVLVTVRHDSGVSTRTLTQDGRSTSSGNADRWNLIGEYSFTAGPDQYVELHIDSSAVPASKIFAGEFAVDAIRFSSRALRDDERAIGGARGSATSATVAAAPGADLASARAAAADSGRNLLVLYTGAANTSSALEAFCSDHSNRAILDSGFVFVKHVAKDPTAPGVPPRLPALVAYGPSGEEILRADETVTSGALRKALARLIRRPDAQVTTTTK